MNIFEILTVVSICLNMFLLGQVYKQNIAIKKIIGVFALIGSLLEEEQKKERIKAFTGKNEREENDKN